MSEKTSSDRAFGVVFAVVFAIIGLWPLLSGGMMRLWALGVGAVFLALALAAPKLLAPLNKLWTAFGLVLNRIMTPLIMSLLFFLAVVPVGLLMRIFGKRPLSLAFEPDAKSYWIVRETPGPEPDSMKHQF